MNPDFIHSGTHSCDEIVRSMPYDTTLGEALEQGYVLEVNTIGSLVPRPHRVGKELFKTLAWHEHASEHLQQINPHTTNTNVLHKETDFVYHALSGNSSPDGDEMGGSSYCTSQYLAIHQYSCAFLAILFIQSFSLIEPLKPPLVVGQ